MLGRFPGCRDAAGNGKATTRNFGRFLFLTESNMVKLPLILASLALALATPTAASQQSSDPFLPTFDADQFSDYPAVTNPYFPIVQGQVRTYRGVPAVESFVFTGQGTGPVILGIQTFKIRDRAFEGDRIVEDTFDYYAQDIDGNVWYFGEDVTNYVYDRDGDLIETNSSSSWRAGVNDALPGYIMPANTSVDFNYYQEFAAADQALDEGTTVAVLPELVVGETTYSNVIQVLETSDLEKNSRTFKYYAPGVGLIAEEEGLRPNFKHPRQVFELVEIAP
jgi:hypothetical protein